MYCRAGKTMIIKLKFRPPSFSSLPCRLLGSLLPCRLFLSRLFLCCLFLGSLFLCSLFLCRLFLCCLFLCCLFLGCFLLCLLSRLFLLKPFLFSSLLPFCFHPLNSLHVCSYTLLNSVFVPLGQTLFSSCRCSWSSVACFSLCLHHASSEINHFNISSHLIIKFITNIIFIMKISIFMMRLKIIMWFIVIIILIMHIIIFFWARKLIMHIIIFF